MTSHKYKMRQKIVDAHIHLWDLNENSYPWLAKDVRSMAIDCGDYGSIKKNYLVEDLLDDAGDLDLLGVVHVQANHDPQDHVRETRWLQKIADAESSKGMPQGIVANVDLQSDDAERVIQKHCAYRNMRGIRQILHKGPLNERPYNPLLDPKWLKNFALLARHELVFDVHALPYQADDVAKLIRSNPQTTFTITHCGLPLWRDGPSLDQWKLHMQRYASHPNACVKISGFGLFDLQWTPASIRETVMECVEIFGADRCILASNYPVETLARPYRYVWAAFLELFKDFSPAEKDALFYRNAERVYRLELPKPSNTEMR